MLPGNPSRCARAPEEASFRLCSSAIRACRSAWKNVFKKKKFTFPALNCDNISGLNELYTKKQKKAKKKKSKKKKTKTIKKAGKKKTNTDQWRREMPLWHLEHNGRNATIVTYLQHDGS